MRRFAHRLYCRLRWKAYEASQAPWSAGDRIPLAAWDTRSPFSTVPKACGVSRYTKTKVGCGMAA